MEPNPAITPLTALTGPTLIGGVTGAGEAFPKTCNLCDEVKNDGLVLAPALDFPDG